MNRFIAVAAGLWAVLSAGGPARADVLYQQPATTTGITIQSSTWDPDGSDWDQMAWDGFMLASPANITEVQWRGRGGTINFFEVAIYASIPAGTQPDLGYMYPGPLVRYFTNGNANPTYAGTFGGTAMYDYRFTLPHSFAAAAGVRYWIYIVAWQPGIPSWGLATATGGNGSHFHRVAGAADAYYYIGSNDLAFTLIGNPSGCTAPTITQHPQPASVCAYAANFSLNVAASGSGTLSYQWRRNGYVLYDGPWGGGMGGPAYYAGATTPTLTVSPMNSFTDNATFDCVVTNSCSTTTSNPALVTIRTTGPDILQAPAPTVAPAGGFASFTVLADGVGTLWYQWYHDGVPLADDPGGHIAGSQSPDLLIADCTPADAGLYACLVIDDCGDTTTAPAALDVYCPGDLDDGSGTGTPDGGVDVNDLLYFLDRFEQGNVAVDLDDGSMFGVPDGAVDINDLLYFLAHFEVGC